MKKNIFIILLTMFVSFTAMSDEYSLFTGNAYNYNDFSKSLDKTQFLIKYDDTAKYEYNGGFFIGGTYYLFTENLTEKIWIYLNENDLQTIRDAIIKYQDWVKLAKEKQIEIDKKIPNLKIRTHVVWKLKLFDEWYSASGLILEFTVFSRNPQRHELIITSNKVTPDGNSFIDVELNPLYFEEKEAADFLSCLDESNITKKKEEYNKKKEMQDYLFN